MSFEKNEFVGLYRQPDGAFGEAQAKRLSDERYGTLRNAEVGSIGWMKGHLRETAKVLSDRSKRELELSSRRSAQP